MLSFFMLITDMNAVCRDTKKATEVLRMLNSLLTTDPLKVHVIVGVGLPSTWQVNAAESSSTTLSFLVTGVKLGILAGMAANIMEGDREIKSHFRGNNIQCLVTDYNIQLSLDSLFI